MAEVHGPAAGLAALDEAVAAEPALAGHHRVHAVRAHLLELAGDPAAARAEYGVAARRTLSLPGAALPGGPGGAAGSRGGSRDPAAP